MKITQPLKQNIRKIEEICQFLKLGNIIFGNIINIRKAFRNDVREKMK